MRPAAHLLLLEAEALPDVLQRAGPDLFDLPTPCPGWSVRDVIAHCAAALEDLLEGTIGGFTPEENQLAVDARKSWPLERVVEELVGAYIPAADRIDELDGAADGLGLGEWVHGGDIRLPLGEPDAYASAGIDLAIELVAERSRQRSAPGVTATVDGTERALGSDPVRGALVTDAATFIRIVAGRQPLTSHYELTGDLTVDELRLFS